MNKEQVYLSATSLLPEEEIDRRVVFFLEPHVTESAKRRLQGVGYEVMPKIWNDNSYLEESHSYLEKAYARFSEKIGLALSRIHRLDYPPFFWEIPIARWLLHYLHAIFDRYSRLKRAVELYGIDNVSLFACRCDIKAPSAINDFVTNTSKIDRSVSAFYGMVAAQMGIALHKFSSNGGCPGEIFIGEKRVDFFSPSFYERLFRRLKSELLSPLPPALFQGKNICMSAYCFSKREKVAFSRALGACFFPQAPRKVRLVSRQVDRTALQSIQAEDEFERIAVNLLPGFMPRYLLEEFESYREEAGRWDGFKNYFSATDWYTNILFCYAASLGRLRGAKILACQHGGGYGQYKRPHSEFVERKFSDIFITWGWKDTQYPGSELLPLPSPELSHYFNRHRPQNETVLWSSTTRPQQVVRFGDPIPEGVPKYLDSKRDFISSLAENVRRVLVYRPYARDFGWLNGEKKIFRDYTGVRFEYSGRLPAVLQKIRLYICDNQHTSFMQALVSNTPTILFWHRTLYDERESAVPAFDLLRDAGILFHEPLKAAEQVNAVFGDVQGWWMDARRQNARLKFMQAFCRADIHWQEKWIEALRERLAGI